MTTFTDKELIKEIRERIGSLDVRDNIERLAYEIALASLEAVSDERAAYELFMEKRFGESVDRRRAKNGDGEYMAWDMAIGWIIWCHRAAMPQAGNFREISETSTCSPVTPSGWISCSERMPEDTKMLLAFSQGKIVAAYWNWVMSPIDYKKYRAFTYLSGNILDDVTHWMPLLEPPEQDGE
ncbi:DUF551 domain-containing protein [Escherichia coli]|nr:DUF551 domain-containing protein [Escherichia coli]EKH2308784.1 DUF551 domain-containing protein [Escherichia coli]EKI3814261.1 DUF551 domain-containing protein [Escherichia coli]ELP5128831.1 DUF551 domain-containing protein [Escherichia coli]MCX1917673.1 DUF551 domain-containing protein [Escherichia coli]